MESRTQWAHLVRQALEVIEREQIGSPCPLVDHEVSVPATGEPDEIRVWLICRNRSEKRLFLDSGLARLGATLRQRLLAAGFPETALVSLRTEVTSREEIDARGGRIGTYR